MVHARPLRMLVLSPVAPYPPHGGWAMVIYNDVCRLVEQGHSVYLLACTEDASADIDAMERVCPSLYFYGRKPARWWQAARNIGAERPFSVARYFVPALLDAARSLVTRVAADVILIEDVAMATYGGALRQACGVPFFVRAHNVDAQIVRRFIQRQRNPLLRWAAAWQLRKLQRYEGAVLREADGYSMISTSDAVELKSLYPDLRPQVIGAGTDLERFRVATGPRSADIICHVGSLSAHTKLEAMLWFCREVMPLIQLSRPHVELQLVGVAPRRYFSRFKGVRVIGRVADEVPYLHRGRVFVAPQFVGSGVRLKILNAMATGNAIVCTSIGCEGIPVVDGRHVLICDEAHGFARSVLMLLSNGRVADELGYRAREFVERHYNWNGIIADLVTQLRQLAR